MSEHEVADLKGYINEENNKNKHKITCTKCSCVILRQSDGCFSETEVSAGESPFKLTKSSDVPIANSHRSNRPNRSNCP